MRVTQLPTNPEIKIPRDLPQAEERQFIFKPTDILVRFDIVSLFTNVPLNHTINLITNTIYKTNSRPAVEKQDFKKMLEIATSGVFLCRDKLYL